MKFNEIDFSIRNILLFFAIVVLFALIYATRDILLLFTISVLIAYLLNPLVEVFVKIRIPRFLSVLILVLILIFILLLILTGILPVMINDIKYLINHTPEYISNVFTFIEKLLAKYNIQSSLDFETSKAYITERLDVISKYLLNTLSSAALSAANIAGVLVNVFIVPVLVFFLLVDFPDFKQFTNKVVERFNMQKIIEHITQFETLLGKYFRGMFLVGTILSVLYSLVLYIVDVKGWLFIGILTGYGAMIPYVGFTIGLISAIIATALTYVDIIHPIYTIIGYVIVQVLESMVITPKIVGDSLGISPVVVIVGLMIGGALGGFIGMIIALPIAAFIKILIDTYIFRKPLPAVTKNKQNDDNNDAQNTKNTKASEQ